MPVVLDSSREFVSFYRFRSHPDETITMVIDKVSGAWQRTAVQPGYDLRSTIFGK